LTRVRTILGMLVALVAAAGLLVGCSSTGSAPHGGPPAPAALTLTPAAGATNADPGSPAVASAPNADLTSVQLLGPDGQVIPGAPSPDGHRWSTTAPLAYGASYTWSGTAKAPAGPTPVTGSFTTLSPPDTTKASFAEPDDNSTVGVAAPIILQFRGPVQNKAGVERAITVHTSVPVVGAWAWLPDDNGGARLHYRPQNYWPENTVVDVTANLLGVDLGGGTFGAADISTHFTVGRSMITKADINSHHLVVVQDGRTVMDVPASYGLGTDPNRITRNGTHVVMDKQQTVLMSNPAYGYVNEPEHWAVRISNNGEFIHANPNSASAQGSSNVTHGCANLSEADAMNYFNTVTYGDPVEVTGSPIPLSGADGDIYDWAVPWDQWTALSALSGQQPHSGP
jgi:lipoprotein-anchoring transpeptidase ErfK/SrfK